MQRNRYFPMLDYELSEERRVKVTLYGKVIDANYSRLLSNNPLNITEWQGHSIR